MTEDPKEDITTRNSVKEEEDNVSILSGWEEAVHDVPQLPGINIDRDFIIAKGYLQRIGCRNETVWDHLTDILNHVLKERPPDCMRYFEEFSRELRIKKFFLNKDCNDQYNEFEEERKDMEDSKQLLRFFRRVECLYESETPYDDRFGTQDLLAVFKLLQEAGVGFQYNDEYNIQMSMRLLPKIFPIEKLNFWGIVWGTLRNYLVMEAELTPEAMSKRAEMFYANLQKAQYKVPDAVSVPPVSSQDEEEEEFSMEEMEEAEVVLPKRKLDTYVMPPLPVPILPEKVVVPPEAPGQGVNRKVYYVANEPGEEWFELPDVTPEQIVIARQRKRYLTGVLTNEVPGYPKFPGTERELLRAQIARITATTHASPLGYYSSGGEEEAVELDEGTLYVENVDYQPHPVRDLLDPTLEFWVHDEPFILKQGRTVFWSPSVGGEEGEAEDEGEEGEEPSGKATVEKGPPILSSLSGDAMADATPPWFLRKVSILLDEDASVVLRSNLWPGALTACRERLFISFYVGWAVKCDLHGFNPVDMEKVQSEYPLGPEIMEITDPTVEMEEFRWMQLHPPIMPDHGEGEGEEEEHGEIEEEGRPD